MLLTFYSPSYVGRQEIPYPNPHYRPRSSGNVYPGPFEHRFFDSFQCYGLPHRDRAVCILLALNLLTAHAEIQQEGSSARPVPVNAPCWTSSQRIQHGVLGGRYRVQRSSAIPTRQRREHELRKSSFWSGSFA